MTKIFTPLLKAITYYVSLPLKEAKIMYKIILLVIISINSTFLTAQTFEPFVIIDPAHPIVGDTIRVGVAHTFHPPCLTLPATNFEGLTHLFEYDKNNIQLTAVDNSDIIPICNPFPVSPALRAYYELGQLPEGTYSLETWIIDNTTPLPIPSSGYFPLVYGPTLLFEVNRPISIDVFSIEWQTLYMFLILLITYLIKRNIFFHSK